LEYQHPCSSAHGDSGLDMVDPVSVKAKPLAVRQTFLNIR